MPHRARFVPVQRAQITDHAVCVQRRDQREDRRRIVFTRHAGRPRKVRSAAKNLTDHPRARRLRPRLHEQSHAVGIGLLNRGRKVETAQGLFRNRSGGRFTRNVVRPCRGNTVKSHAGRGGRRVPMQLAIRIFNRADNRAMHGRRARQRNRLASQACDHGIHVAPLPADHALIGRVDDKQVRAVRMRNRIPYRLAPTVHHGDVPIHSLVVGQLPRSASRQAGPHEVCLKQR